MWWVWFYMMRGVASVPEVGAYELASCLTSTMPMGDYAQHHNYVGTFHHRACADGSFGLIRSAEGNNWTIQI